MAWTCPDCDRRFARQNQTHTCVPGTTVDAWLAGRPPEQRAVHDAVVNHLRAIGPVRVEAVEVGILVKRRGTFVELRPRYSCLALSFILHRPLEHPRIMRRIEMTGGRAAYFVDLKGPADVDDDVRDWLTEAYLDAPA